VKKFLGIGAGILLVTALTGCSGQAQTQAGAVDEEIPAEATPEQLASVIAKHESSLRGAIGSKADCRAAQGYAALSDASTTEIAAAEDCMRVLTAAAADAGTAAAELSSLPVPASMTDLVEDTTRYLDQVHSIDLATICGGAPYGPQCTSEDLEFDLAYKRLEQQLDAWGPYL